MAIFSRLAGDHIDRVPLYLRMGFGREYWPKNHETWQLLLFNEHGKIFSHTKLESCWNLK